MEDGYVIRHRYLDMMMGYRRNPELIKVLTGIRRCGKSVILEQFRKRLMSEGFPEDNIIMMDLERMRYIIDSERMLHDHLSRSIKNDAPVILLDEVQLVKGWERAVESIRLQYHADFYITGSNSDTVSESLGTHLTGRYVEINVFPFSFAEFLDRYPIDDENGYPQRLEQYLRYGGMPIIDLNDDLRKNRTILRGVYDSIINNDIRPRVELDQSVLENTTAFMLSNISNLTSYNNIAKQSLVGDQRTVEKYLDKLCGCFIFYKADRYDVIGKKHLKTNAKFYLADTGFKDAVLLGSEYNEGALLENAVYIELLRRGYRVCVGAYKDKEIDFTAWKDGGPEFYQVCLKMSDAAVLKRETGSLSAIKDGRKVIITRERDMPDVPEGIEVIDAVDFLLGER